MHYVSTLSTNEERLVHEARVQNSEKRKKVYKLNLVSMTIDEVV